MRIFLGKKKHQISIIIMIALLLPMIVPGASFFSFANGDGTEGLIDIEGVLSTESEDKTVTEAVYSGPDDFQFLTNIELTDEDGQPLEDDVDKSAKVRITYYYEIEDEFVVDVEKPYTLTIPEEIKIVEDMEIELNSGDLMATVNIYTDNSVTIKFAEGINDLYDRHGYFYVYTEFNEETIGDGGETDIVFDLGGESTHTITVKFEEEPETVDVILNKTGDYDKENNLITWNIKVTPETSPNLKPIHDVVIKDIIQEGHNYVEDSAQITPAVAGEFTWDNDKTLTYQFNEPINTTEGEEYTITFNTRPELSAFDSEGKVLSFRNEVEGTFEGGESQPDDAVVKTTVDFISKSGKYNPGTKSIDWTVTINSNNLKLSNAIIRDELPNSGDDFPLKLITDSIELDGNPISISGPLTYDGYTIEYVFDEEINEKHTLTYSTEVVDPDAFNSNTQKKYKNNVTLVGDGVPGDATDGKEVGVPTSVIKKVGSGYNPSTHEITWKVTVNSNKIEIINPVVTDDIPTGLEYVPGSFRVAETPVSEGFTYTPLGGEPNKTGTISYNFEGYKNDDKINDTYILEFETKVLDNNLWANNASKTFRNTAKLDGDNITESTSEGSQKVTSEVIKKTGIDYNYLTREATWKIVVNQNEMTITNAYVVDPIGEYQEFVPGSVTINGNPAQGGAEEEKGKYFFDEATKTLRYNFEEVIDKEQTITFKTKIPEDKLDIFYENGAKLLENKATLYGEEIPDSGVSSEGNNKVNNTVVSKKGLYTNGNAFIDWEVVINQNQIPIENVILEDTLQEGLELDTSSVKLFKLEVDTDGKYSIGEEIHLTASNIKYNSETRKFEFHFTENIEEAYMLRFTTDIADTHKDATFKNTIHFKGSTGSESGTSDNVKVKFQTGGGGAGGTTRGSITLIKVDQDYPNKTLKGAIFELLDQYQNVLKTSEPTGENGEVVFKGLKFDTTYYVREKASPDGYVLDDTPYEFQVVDEAGKKDIERNFENTIIKGNMEFTKLDESNEPLAGAEFSLYRALDETFVAKAESDASGKVVFKDIAFGSYVIKETRAPESYLLSDVVLKATISENGATIKANPESVSNTKIKGNIEFTKLGEGEEPLAGAEFSLYRAEEETSTPLAKAISDANGKVLFTNIDYGNYVIKETQAPAGYQLSDIVLKASIVENGVTVKADPNRISNHKIKGNIEFTKLGEGEELLAGAEFTLYRADDEASPVAEALSDADGKVVFKDIAIGSYVIKETKAPEGYLLSDLILKAVINENGTTVKANPASISNAKIRGNIEFTKQGESNEPLTGAEFSLYRALDETFVAKAESDASGKVVFESIAYGSYLIKETRAPEGYLLSDVVLKATISENGATVKANPESIANTIIRGSLEVLKVDRYTSRPLANAKIAIYTEGDVLVAEKITDNNGIARFENLAYGKYYFKETLAPAGYVRNSEAHLFEIRENEVTVKVTLENRKKSDPDPDPDDPDPDPKDPEPKDPDPKDPEPKDPDPKDPEPKDPDPKDPEPKDPDPKDPEPKDPIEETTPKETPKEGEVDVPEDGTPEIVTPPDNGTVIVDENGKWTYTPNPGFVGKDKFAIKIIHPDGTEEEILVEIDVEDIPLGGIDVLPKTGEGSSIAYYIAGLILVLLGVFLRRKFVQKV